jgi:hypothetical protein
LVAQLPVGVGVEVVVVLVEVVRVVVWVVDGIEVVAGVEARENQLETTSSA